MSMEQLLQSDPRVANAIAEEMSRQEAHIELIASENYASPAVMAAQGTHLTNKYAEGYPGKRYYGGLILAAGGDEALYKKLNGAVFPGQQGGPLMHVIATRAVAFKEAMNQAFVRYQQRVIDNAALCARHPVYAGSASSHQIAETATA